MRVHIFDVEQGECNIIETPTGHTVMIGSGHNSSTGWHPSQWLKTNNICLTNFVIPNFDEDHVSDLLSFEPELRPAFLTYNFNTTPLFIREIKGTTGIGDGVNTALHWVENVFIGERVYFDYGIEKQHFYHSPEKFQDLNNLSTVTFISYKGVGILFPSDIQKEGWGEFLKDPTFVECLQRTKILLAAHHGRDNGYSEEAMSLCKNLDAVIISDKSIEYETQEHDLYSKHCKGVPFPSEVRKVLTTRKHGKMTIDVYDNGTYFITTIN